MHSLNKSILYTTSSIKKPISTVPILVIFYSHSTHPKVSSHTLCVFGNFLCWIRPRANQETRHPFNFFQDCSSFKLRNRNIEYIFIACMYTDRVLLNVSLYIAMCCFGVLDPVCFLLVYNCYIAISLICVIT